MTHQSLLPHFLSPTLCLIALPSFYIEAPVFSIKIHAIIKNQALQAFSRQGMSLTWHTAWDVSQIGGDLQCAGIETWTSSEPRCALKRSVESLRNALQDRCVPVFLATQPSSSRLDFFFKPHRVTEKTLCGGYTLEMSLMYIRQVDFQIFKYDQNVTKWETYWNVQRKHSLFSRHRWHCLHCQCPYFSPKGWTACSPPLKINNTIYGSRNNKLKKNQEAKLLSYLQLCVTSWQCSPRWNKHTQVEKMRALYAGAT